MKDQLPNNTTRLYFLIENWERMILDDQQSHQLGEMPLATLNNRKRDFEDKIRSARDKIASIEEKLQKPEILDENTEEHQIRVFITYSRQDSHFVDRLDAELQARNIYTWVDRYKLEGGDNWTDIIQEAINKCDVMLVIVSPKLLESKFAKMEYIYATTNDIPIIPILYQEVSEVPIVLNNIQWVESFRLEFQKGLDDLLVALTSIRHPKITYSGPNSVKPRNQLTQFNPKKVTLHSQIYDLEWDIPLLNSTPDQPLSELYHMGLDARARKEYDLAAFYWEQLLRQDPYYQNGIVTQELRKVKEQLESARKHRLRKRTKTTHDYVGGRKDLSGTQLNIYTDDISVRMPLELAATQNRLQSDRATSVRDRLSRSLFFQFLDMWNVLWWLSFSPARFKKYSRADHYPSFVRLCMIVALSPALIICIGGIINEVPLKESGIASFIGALGLILIVFIWMLFAILSTFVHSEDGTVEIAFIVLSGTIGILVNLLITSAISVSGTILILVLNVIFVVSTTFFATGYISKGQSYIGDHNLESSTTGLVFAIFVVLLFPTGIYSDMRPIVASGLFSFLADMLSDGILNLLDFIYFFSMSALIGVFASIFLPSYINQALYEGKPNELTIAVTTSMLLAWAFMIWVFWLGGWEVLF